MLEWMMKFLMKRQYVGLIVAFSEWIEVISGILQRSVLGAVLPVLLFYDLLESVTSCVYLFTNDTKIFRGSLDSTTKMNCNKT